MKPEWCSPSRRKMKLGKIYEKSNDKMNKKLGKPACKTPVCCVSALSLACVFCCERDYVLQTKEVKKQEKKQKRKGRKRKKEKKKKHVKNNPYSPILITCPILYCRRPRLSPSLFSTLFLLFLLLLVSVTGPPS